MCYHFVELLTFPIVRAYKHLAFGRGNGYCFIKQPVSIWNTLNEDFN